MNENERIVRDFIAAWSTLNVDRIVGYFTDDGVYHNIMLQPVAGRENLRKFIQGFVKSWSATDWEIRTLISKGDIVIAERVDRTSLGAKQVALPCCGVFELKDGKIREWRDYFDMATYTKAVA
ncbi:MAG: limonene-1,2-epoxide hydrolase family protein [Alphaproteobacteria bacterium]|jgi:limonene-1,2-epoxide hydrolase|nr:limonene-1,2-epoxide hydrolase family protein [Alphaproteobacteria bacterium]